jgi:hypothetical protein
MTTAAIVQVQPAPGRRVRNPASGDLLPSKGAPVTWSPYWTRRLDDEDIALVQTPAKGSKS